MEDLEIIKHAKSYIDQLAKGIDPLTGEVIDDDSTLNQERLSKCFIYVSEVLQKVIDNDGIIPQKRKKNKCKFTITDEEIAQVTVSNEPISINPFCEIISNVVTDTNVKPLGGTIVTEWLESQGYLTSIPKEYGGIKRIATEKGNEIGIVTTGGQDVYFKKALTYYDKQAQEFILSHLQEILRERQGGANPP